MPLCECGFLKPPGNAACPRCGRGGGVDPSLSRVDDRLSPQSALPPFTSLTPREVYDEATGQAGSSRHPRYLAGVVCSEPKVLTDASFPAPMLAPILAVMVQLIAMCGLGSAVASIVLLATAGLGAFLITMLVLSAMDKPLGSRVVGHFLSGPGALGRLRPVMSFRIQLPDESYETVLIGGHEDGIEFGDEVTVHGYPARARLRATRVSNRTEGSTLRDLSLGVLVFVLWLVSLSLLVSGIAALGAGFNR